ncbi:MAG: 50S ribosomal protein L30 [Candidatus Kapabacteria bacterium]|nr:50S ribosomal protein L30 [Candidatus Kapabacteria bacterium]
MTMPKLKITQVRSTINCKTSQKRTIKALGLGRLHATVIQPKNPCTLGMLNVVQHLVAVEEIAD